MSNEIRKEKVMEHAGTKKGAAGAVLLWAVSAAVLGIALIKVIIKGPLGPIILGNREAVLMMAELAFVFLWNLCWLSFIKDRRKQIAGIVIGTGIFTWLHQIFLPLVLSGIYLFIIIKVGEILNGLFDKNERLYGVEKLAMGLVTGSAFWLTLVCAISFTGHGGLKLWRALWTVLFLAVLVYLFYSKRLKKKKGEPLFQYNWQALLPDTRLQAALGAFLLTMILLQAGRLNLELDYDSLHYGLRSASVLDNGRGIYENLGTVNLVYTYSKGLEVLALPLSGTPTYGFVLAFTFWTTVGSLLLAGHMGKRQGGKTLGFWTAAIMSAIPGIMNMAATAKSDSITLLYQLIIYNFLCLAVTAPSERKSRFAKLSQNGDIGTEKRTKEEKTPWLLMAVSAYLVTLVYKPTALVFSTALGGVGLLCLLYLKKCTIGTKKGFWYLLFPVSAVGGLWYRTWRMTGVPMTSIFAGILTKIGFQVQFPFNFSHVIGDPSELTTAEKLVRLGNRLKGVLFAPVGEDMAHVIIAWGTGLVTVLLLAWAVCMVQKIRQRKEKIREQDVFDGALIAVLTAGSILSIYTLYQVDGNYFMLVYALASISGTRLLWEAFCREKCTFRRTAVGLLAVPFFLCNTVIACNTSWAGTPGFTPVKLAHKGYYEHRKERLERWKRLGYACIAGEFSPHDRVLALGDHPQVLDLPCVVQSYYDVTGSGGNVWLVKKLEYFKDFLRFAGTDYLFVQAGYLAENDRARQIVEDMLTEGTLTDPCFEWGNMRAKVALENKSETPQTENLQQFYEYYSMERVECR